MNGLEQVPFDNAQFLAENGEFVYRIRFVSGKDILRQGFDPIALLTSLNSMDRLWVTAITDRVPYLEDLDYEDCYLVWDMILVSDASIEAIRNLCAIFGRTSDVSIEKINDASDQGCGFRRRLGEILVQRKDVARGDLEEAAQQQKKIGEMLVSSGLVPKEKISSALVEQSVLKQQAEKQLSVNLKIEQFEIILAKIEEFIRLGSELKYAASSDGLRLDRAIDLAGELRECMSSVHLIPAGIMFARLRRAVQGITSTSRIRIDLIGKGGDVLVEREAVDAMSEPLIDLALNSIGSIRGQAQAQNAREWAFMYCEAIQLHDNITFSFEDQSSGRVEAFAHQRIIANLESRMKAFHGSVSSFRSLQHKGFKVVIKIPRAD